MRTDSAGARSFMTDALGSTLALADSTGAVQTSYSYEPFGRVTVTGSASTNSFQYTGRENDGTGVDFNRARYYSPVYQRFISEDPIGLAGGPNLYAYVGNDPVNHADPSGRFLCEGLHGIGHKSISFDAALREGYDYWQAQALAQAVCDVDDKHKNPGTQDSKPEHTHQHAMAGKKLNGNWEPCPMAYAATKQLLGQLLAKGDLPRALHLVQDAWPREHYGYQPWKGILPNVPAAVVHGVADSDPDDWRVQAATDVSALLLKDARNHNFGDPSEYLPNSCQ